MKKLTALLIDATLTVTACYDLSQEGSTVENEATDDRERFTCEVETLEAYGFDGNENEHVCVNPDDFADFVIIEGNYDVGDEVTTIITKTATRSMTSRNSRKEGVALLLAELVNRY